MFAFVELFLFISGMYLPLFYMDGVWSHVWMLSSGVFLFEHFLMQKFCLEKKAKRKKSEWDSIISERVHHWKMWSKYRSPRAWSLQNQIKCKQQPSKKSRLFFSPKDKILLTGCECVCVCMLILWHYFGYYLLWVCILFTHRSLHKSDPHRTASVSLCSFWEVLFSFLSSLYFIHSQWENKKHKQKVPHFHIDDVTDKKISYVWENKAGKNSRVSVTR